MFRFTLQGRIGRIDEVKGSDVIRISLAADRLVEGKDGSFTKTDWVSGVSFDKALNERMLTELEVGQNLKLDGRIEPKKRQVGDVTVYDHSFVISKFERLSAPKAKSTRNPASEPEAAHTAS